jgi:hypothetical protein
VRWLSAGTGTGHVLLQDMTTLVQSTATAQCCKLHTTNVYARRDQTATLQITPADKGELQTAQHQLGNHLILQPSQHHAMNQAINQTLSAHANIDRSPCEHPLALILIGNMMMMIGLPVNTLWR